jgi:hypothetical protein
MPLPGSKREKQFLSEIAEKNVTPVEAPVEPTFLQEIKEPTHEHEELVEEAPEKKKKKSRWKK